MESNKTTISLREEIGQEETEILKEIQNHINPITSLPIKILRRKSTTKMTEISKAIIIKAGGGEEVKYGMTIIEEVISKGIKITNHIGITMSLTGIIMGKETSTKSTRRRK